MKKYIVIANLLFLSLNLFAEKNTDVNSSNAHLATQPKKTNVFDCSPSTTQVDLDINNVRARLLGGGDFWWDGVDLARYEVPKVDASSNAIGVNAIFAGALWFTGLDDGGNLQCAAQTYRNQGHDFWTGPLKGENGDADLSTCNAYDEHFSVYGPDITRLIGVFSGEVFEIDEPTLLGLQDPNDPRSNMLQILEWPGRGNPYYLGTDRFFDEGPLAPFFDFDADGIYNPLKGDYPVIGVTEDDPVTGEKTVVSTFADQMIFWVINDNGQVHGRTAGVPIGVQVNCVAFAYQTSNELNDMTFYSFEIIKKSPNSLFETYMGDFVDPDLGDFNDDFIGCDVNRALGFVYNSNAIDAQYGIPPIIGIDYFEGPTADDGTELGLSSFVYFNNAASGPQTDPDVAPEFRNYQTGFWKDGQPIVAFGDQGTGIGSSGTPTDYIYPGNPAVASEWSECNNQVSGSNVGADRRFVQNSGPFTLVPGDFQRITIGVMAVFEDNYSPCPDIEAFLGPADDLAQNLFDNNFQLTDGPDAPTLAIRELSNQLVISLVNQPASNNFGEGYEQPANIPDNGLIYEDSTYKFQGYLVYQLENPTVTAQDLDDPTKARLVFQADIKDDVADIYNFEEVDGVASFDPILQVEGNNEGITKSFLVTQDLFAEGNSQLINNRNYYYAAISYAYNNFAPFEYPVSTNMQFEPYLQGRRNFRVYSAIPHLIDSRNGGTVLNAEYGDFLEVERLEGSGNGGAIIRFTREQEEAIVNDNIDYFADIVTYELGKDPLQAKVVDPLKLQNVEFEILFKSFNQLFDTIIDTLTSVPLNIDTLIGTSFNPTTSIADSTVWEMYVSRDGQVVDTIFSETDFSREYEQLISDYGISLSVGVSTPIYENLNNGEPIYGPISSNLEFAELDDIWLELIADEGLTSPSNWIRTGDFEIQGNVYNQNIFDSYQYDNLTGADNAVFYDSLDIFLNLLDGSIAPYCLASNYANPNVSESGVDLAPNFLYGPAFRWDVYDVGNNSASAANEVANPINTLEKLRSVEVVITPDQSLWSKCIVFETGEDPDFNEGGAQKGWLRNSSSKQLNGSDVLTGETGRSYFPGYAINTETGERLNISFGESSDLADFNGNDMYWNPTSDLNNTLTEIPGSEDLVPIWGGKHFVYVWSTRYDEGNSAHSTLTNATFSNNIPTEVADLYEDIMYTFIPILSPDAARFPNNRVPEISSEVRMSLNIDRPFQKFGTEESLAFGSNDSLPRYRFSTVGLAPEENVAEIGESALDFIRVVPNPYYAFSAYEESQIDNVVKITNVPNRSVISIYSLDGKLVRRFDRAIGNAGGTNAARQEISDAQVVGGINLDNSLNWNLTNENRIPVGSGTYIIHIDAFDLGEKVVKAVVFMRPTDVNNF